MYIIEHEHANIMCNILYYCCIAKCVCVCVSAYLVDRVEVLVIEVSEEPEHSRTKDLTKQHHKRGKVEDEDHPCQPVKEHHCTYRGRRDEWLL